MIIVGSYKGYSLLQKEEKIQDYYIYVVYKNSNFSSKEKPHAFKSKKEDLSSLLVKDTYNTKTYKAFRSYVDEHEPYDPDSGDLDYTNANDRPLYLTRNKTKGYLEKLNKSNTLVIHCSDRTTDMLSQLYSGKNWDVLNDGNIDPEELHKLIQSHDRIIMLGHGTSHGLINVNGGGYVIDDSFANDLKQKETYSIWCFSDQYFKRNNFGKGEFHTGMIISEVGEEYCMLQHAPLNKQEMLENITYWSKLCAESIDMNPTQAVNYILERYTGDDEVTQFNRTNTQVL